MDSELSFKLGSNKSIEEYILEIHLLNPTDSGSGYRVILRFNSFFNAK